MTLSTHRLARFVSVVLLSCLIATLALSALPAQTALASDQTLGGDPINGSLRITVSDNGRTAVYRYVNGGWQNQIYGGSSKGSHLYAGGVGYDLGYFGGTGVTFISNTRSGNEIVTVWKAGNVRVTQTLTYYTGDAYYRLEWAIKNEGSSNLSDVRFFNGEDTYLAGGDSGAGWWDGSNNTIGVRKTVNGQEQRLALQGVTVPQYYQSNHYGSVRSAVANNRLTNAIDPNASTDNGYALEWDKSSLVVNETWNITAFEKFDAAQAGGVRVTAPVAVDCQTGATCSLTYTVANIGSTNASGSLSLSSSAGWSAWITSSSSYSLGVGASTQVNVNVSVPSGASGSSRITLTAQPSSGNAVSDTASVNAVAPPNANPVNLALNQPQPVLENQPSGTFVGTLSASDPEGKSLSYALATSTAEFRISGNQLLTNAPLNYEAGATRSLDIVVTDPDGGRAQRNFTIQLGNINEAPVISGADAQTLTMAEDGTFSHSFSASDPDAGTTLSWSLTSAATTGSASASGTGSTPNLTFTPPADWSGTSSFTLQVSDGSLTDSVAVTVNVTPVNDAPELSGPTSAITRIGTALTLPAFPLTDRDALTDPLQVTLTASNGVVAQHGSAGLTFTPAGDGGAPKAQLVFSGSQADLAAALNGVTFTPNGVFSGSASVTVVVTDLAHHGAGGAKTDSQTVAIQVTNPPSFSVSAAAQPGDANYGYSLFPTINEALAAERYAHSLALPLPTLNVLAGEYTEAVNLDVPVTANLADGVILHGDLSVASGTLTPHGHFTLAGDLSVTSGTLDASQATVNFTGDHALSGTLTLKDFTIAEGASRTLTTGSALTWSGTWSGTGSFTAQPNASLHVDGSGDHRLPAAALSFADLNLVSGRLIAPAGTLNVTGTLNHTGGTFDPNGGTLVLSGDTVHRGAWNFANLRTTGSLSADTAWTVSGLLEVASGSFAPFINSSFNHVQVASGATLTAPADLFVSGNWAMNGTFATDPGDLVEFVGLNSTTLTGLPQQTFANLRFAKTAPAQLDASALTRLNVDFVDHLTSGFSAPPEMVVTGGFYGSSAASFTPNGGRVTFQGSNTYLLGKTSFHNVTADGGTLTVRDTSTLGYSGAVTFTNGGALDLLSNDTTLRLNGSAPQTLPSGMNRVDNLSIATTASLTAPAEMILDGDLANFGALLPGSGHVLFSNLGPHSITGSSPVQFHDVTLEGPVSLNNGVLVSGDWIDNGGLTANTSPVTFNGDAAQSLSGSQPLRFYDLEVTNTAALPSDDADVHPLAAVTVDHRLTVGAGQFRPFTGSQFVDVLITGEGTLRPDFESTQSVSGSWERAESGWFEANSSTIHLVGDAAQPMLGSATFYNLTIDNRAALNDASDVDPNLAVVVEGLLHIADGQFQPPANSKFNHVLIGPNGQLKPDGNITIGGDLTNQVPAGFGFLSNGRAVTFDGRGAANAVQTLTGKVELDNLTVNQNTTLRLAQDADLGYRGSFVLKGELDASHTPNTLSLLGSGSQSLPDQVHQVNNLYIASGATLQAPAALSLSGNLDVDGGFNANTGTLTFNGTTPQGFTGDNTNLVFHNLTIAPAATLRLGSDSNLRLDGALSGTGTLDARTNSPTTVTALNGASLRSGLQLHHLVVPAGANFSAPASLHLSGNLEVDGSFAANNGTLVLDGSAPQTVRGQTHFYNLTLASTSAGTALNFNQAITVDNLLRVQSGRLALAAADLQNVTLDAAGTLAASGPFTVSGNWLEDGTFLPEAGQTVTFDGADLQTINASAPGKALSFSGLTAAHQYDPYADNHDLLAGANVTLNAANLHVQEGQLRTLVCGAFGSVTIDSGASFKPASECTLNGNWINNGAFSGAGIAFSGAPSVVSGSNLNFPNGLSVTAGRLELPDGTSTTHVLLNGGTLALSGDHPTLSLSGNWTNTSGGFDPGTGTVRFNGSAAQTVTGQPTTFFGLELANASGLNAEAAPTVTDLTVTNGTFTLPAGAQMGNVTLNGGTLALAGPILISGDWTHNGGTFTHNGYSLTLNGDGPQALTGSVDTQFADLIIGTLAPDHAPAVTSDLDFIAATLTVRNGSLTFSGSPHVTQVALEATGGLTSGAGTLTVDGNWTDARGGTPPSGFTPGTGTVLLSNAFPHTVSGSNFNHLTCEEDCTFSTPPTIAGLLHVLNGTTTLPGGADLHAVTVATGATLAQTDGTITVSGDWLLHGTFAPADATTVDFDGSTDQRIASATSPIVFENLVITNDGAVTFTDFTDPTPAPTPLTVTGTLTPRGGDVIIPDGSTLEDVDIQDEGTLTFDPGTITVNGQWSNHGTFDQGGATITGSYILTTTFVDDSYPDDQPGLGWDHFRTLSAAINAASVDAAVQVETGNYPVDLTLAKNVNLSLNGDITLNSLTLEEGVFDLNGYTLTLLGNLTHNAGTLVAGEPTSTLKFAGAGPAVIDPLDAVDSFDVANLIVATTGGADDAHAVTCGLPLNVTHFTLESGQLILPGDSILGHATLSTGAVLKLAENSTSNVTASWSNQGSLVRNGGTLHFPVAGTNIAAYVWVDADYTLSTDGFGVDHFDDLSDALDHLAPTGHLTLYARDDGAAYEAVTIADATEFLLAEDTQIDGLSLDAPSGMRSALNLGGHTLTVLGDLTLGNTQLISAAGALQFGGSLDQTATLSGVVETLVVEKPTGAVTLAANSLHVNTLTVTSGRLIMPPASEVVTVNVGPDGVLALPADASLNVIDAFVALDNDSLDAGSRSTVSFVNAANGPFETAARFENLTIRLNSPSLEIAKTGNFMTVSGTLSVERGQLTLSQYTNLNDVNLAADGVLKLTGADVILSLQGDWTQATAAGLDVSGATDSQVSFAGLADSRVSGPAHFQRLQVLKGGAAVSLSLSSDTVANGMTDLGSGKLLPACGAQLLGGVSRSGTGQLIAPAACEFTLGGAVTLPMGSFTPGDGTVLLAPGSTLSAMGPFNHLKIQPGAPSSVTSSLEVAGALTLLSGADLTLGPDAIIQNGLIQPGASLTLTQGDLRVNGSWDNQGTLTAGGSGVLDLQYAMLDRAYVDALDDHPVNDHFASINAAFVRLNPGGTVIVANGTYNEDVVLGQNAVLETDASLTFASFAMSAGTFNGPDRLTVNGNFAHTGGTLDLSTTDVILAGGPDAALTGSFAFNTLRVEDSVDASDLTALSTDGLLVVTGGTFTVPCGSSFYAVEIANGATLAVPDETPCILNVETTWEQMGSFTANQSTVTFSGTPGLFRGLGTFYNVDGALTLDDGAELTVTGGVSGTLDGATHPTSTLIWDGSGTFPTDQHLGNLEIASGATFSAPAALHLAGTLTNAGTFTPGSGTVTFDGNDASAVVGSVTFHDLIVAMTAPGTFEPASGTAFHDLHVNSGRLTTADGASLTLSGDLIVAPTASAVLAGTHFLLNGTEPQTMQAGGNGASDGGERLDLGGLILDNPAGARLLPNNPSLFGPTVLTRGTLTTPSGTSLQNVTFIDGTLAPVQGLTVRGQWSDPNGRFTSPSGTTVTFGNSSTYSGRSTFANVDTEIMPAALTLLPGSDLRLTGHLQVGPMGFTAAPGSTVTLLDNAASLTSGMTLYHLSVADGVDVTPPTNLTLLGDLTLTGDWRSQPSDRLTFDGALAQSILGAGVAQFGQLTVSNSLTSAQGLSVVQLTVDQGVFAPAADSGFGHVSLTGGEFAPQGNLGVAGNWAFSGGTFTPGSGTLFFNGGAGQTVSGSATFGAIEIALESGTALTLPAGTQVADMTWRRGGLTLPGTLNVSGDWNGAGGVLSAGSVVFNGSTSQTFSGNTTFYDLTTGAQGFSLAPASTLRLGNTLSVDGSLSADPTARLDLLGAASTLPNGLTLGTLGLYGAFTAPAELTLSGSLDNQGGSFDANHGQLTFIGSGTVASTNGPLTFHNLTSSGTLNLGSSGVDGTLTVNNGTFTTGSATYENVLVSAGTLVVPDGASVTVTGSWNNAAGTVAANGATLAFSEGGPLSGVNHFGTLSLLSGVLDASGATLTADNLTVPALTSLVLADGVQLGNVQSAGNISLADSAPGDSPEILLSGVWTNLDPAINLPQVDLTANGPDAALDGNFIFRNTTLADGATLTLGDNTQLTLTGNLLAEGSGSLDASAPGNRLILSGSGEQHLPDGLVLNDLTVSPNAVLVAPPHLTLNGSFVLTPAVAPSLSGAFLPGTGTLTLGGSGQTLPDGLTLHNLIVSGPVTAEGALTLGGSLTVADGGTLSATGTLSVAGDLNLNSGGTLAPASTLELGGDWNGGGTFTPGTSTVLFNGSGDQTVSGQPAPSFYNLTQSGGGVLSFADPLTLLSTGTVEVIGGELSLPVNTSLHHFILGPAGAATQTGATLIVSGSWSDPNGNFDPGTPDTAVLFTPSGPQTLSGLTPFNNLAVLPLNSGSLTTSGNFNVLGEAILAAPVTLGDSPTFNDLTVAPTGSLTLASGAEVTVSGAWENQGQVFAQAGSLDLATISPVYVVPIYDPAAAGAGVDTFGTIADAQAHVSDSGTILVAAGTYAEAVTLNQPGVTLRLQGAVTVDSLDFQSGTLDSSAAALSVVGDVTAVEGVIFAPGSQIALPAGSHALHGPLNLPSLDNAGTTTSDQAITVSTELILSDGVLTPACGSHFASVSLVNGVLAAAQDGACDLYVSGDWDVSGSGSLGSASLTLPAPTLVFDGAGDQAITSTGPLPVFESLRLEKTDGILSHPTTAVQVDNLRILSGRLETGQGAQYGTIEVVSGEMAGTAGESFTVTGDWTNLGRFENGGGLVILSGDGTQTLSGAFTFNNLTLAPHTLGATHSVMADLPLRVDGLLDLAGSSLTVGDDALLHDVSLSSAGSLHTPTDARLTLTGDLVSTGDPFSMTSGTLVLAGSDQALSALGALHNLTVDLSGAPYTALLSQPFTLSGGLEVRTGSLSVPGGPSVAESFVTGNAHIGPNGGLTLTGSGYLDFGGTFQNEGAFDPGVVVLSGGAPITAWVNESYDLNTPGFGLDHFADLPQAFEKSAAGATIHLFAGNYTAPAVQLIRAVTLSVEGAAHVEGSLDMTDGVLTFFGPGAALDLNGSLTLAGEAELHLGAGTLNLAGNLSAAPAAVTSASDGWLILDGSGSQTLTGGSFTFANLTVRNTADPLGDDADVEPAQSITVLGQLIVEDGQFSPWTCSRFGSVEIREGGLLSPHGTDCSGEIFVSGSWDDQTTSGGLLSNGGTVVLNGTDTQTLSGPTLFHGLRLDNASGNPVSGTIHTSGPLTLTQGELSLSGDSEVGSVNILNGAVLTLADVSTLDVAGNWDNAGTFTPATSTVTFSGSTPTLTGATTFYNLVVENGLNSASPITVTEDFTLDGGTASLTAGTHLNDVNTASGSTLSAPAAGELFIGGDWVSGGGFEANGGTVTFEGDSTLTGSPTFNHLNVTGNLDAQDAIIVNGGLNVSGTAALADGSDLNDVEISGTLAPAGGLLVSGDWDNTGTFTPGSGTVTFDGSQPQTLSGTLNFNNLEWRSTSDQPGQIEDELTVSGGLNLNQGSLQLPALAHLNDVNLAQDTELISAPSGLLEVGGDWDNDGSFTPQTGSVTFNGSGPQILGGSSPTPFNNLTLDNSGGLTAEAPIQVGGTTLVETGVLDGIDSGSSFGDLTVGPAGGLGVDPGAALTVTGTYSSASSLPVDTHSSPLAPIRIDLAAPDTTTPLTSPAVAENQPSGTRVADLALLDLDADPSDSPTYALLSGGENFSIVGNQLRTAARFDREAQASYDLTIEATDADGGTLRRSLSVSISNVNEAPTIAGEAIRTLSMDEDSNPTPFTLALVSSDPDGDRLTWSVSTAADNGAVTVDAGQVAYEPKADWNGEDRFSLRVSDGEFNAEVSVTVTVNARNDPPEPEGPPTLSQSGPVALGTPVQVSSGKWNDTRDTQFRKQGQNATLRLSYQWRRAADSLGTSALDISGAVASEYRPTAADLGAWISVRVTATDSGLGLPVEQSASIDSEWIEVVGRGPSAIRLSKLMVSAAGKAGDLVALLSATDPDAGERFQYDLVAGDNDNALFQLDGSALLLAADIDGSQESFTLDLRVTDSTGLSYDQRFTLGLEGANQAPTAIKLSSSVILRGLKAGQIVAALSAEDPDLGDSFTYELLEGGDSFTLNGSALTLKVGVDGSVSTWNLQVRATDRGGLSVEQSFTLTLVTDQFPLDPSTETTLDLPGGASLTLPPQTAAQGVTLAYLPQDAAQAPAGQRFAGQAFELQAYRDGERLLDFSFNPAARLTLTVPTPLIRTVNESSLWLGRWDGSAWVPAACAGAEIERDLQAHTLSVPVCAVGQFALFGDPLYQMILPVIYVQ